MWRAMGEPWASYGRAMGELWASHGRAMGELWASYASTRSPPHICGVFDQCPQRAAMALQYLSRRGSRRTFPFIDIVVQIESSSGASLVKDTPPLFLFLLPTGEFAAEVWMRLRVRGSKIHTYIHTYIHMYTPVCKHAYRQTDTPHRRFDF